MCGICGKLNFEPDSGIEIGLLQGMLDTIRHRGPDDEGIYVSSQIGLGHRRLSIIDLNSGRQPICNEDGTVWIVFNGEIYNFQELRSSLLSQGHIFRTQTDTEVIVHLYEELGPQCVEKLRGMFAFAIWDEKSKTLFLARDRVGIKPLYYCQTPTSLVFASEIKALLADPTVPREIAPEIIDRFLTFLYLPGDETLFKGIRKLAPGHYLLLKNRSIETRQYWDLRFSAQRRGVPIRDSEAELLHILEDSVRRHMIADVPVGVLLSGGVDSTAVLSLAANNSAQQLNTYTVGFSGAGITDERPYATLAATAFGSKHREITISPEDFSNFIPRYIWHMEEPVCEPPAIAMYYISRVASERVKVLLSGEGGDEAFAGYSNYRNILWLERLKRFFPMWNDAAAAGLSRLNSWLHSKRLAKYGPLLRYPFPNYYYSRTSTSGANGTARGHWYSDEFAATIDPEMSADPVRRLFHTVKDQDVLNQMLYIDTKTWLPDDLLIKADRMTMASSLELRVPLLDHVVLEFAASLPTHYKVNGINLKYIYKRALSSRIPRKILKRKKVGFPVPYERWLGKELSGFTEELLTDRTTIERGYFNQRAIRAMLSANRTHGSHAKELFSLVTLEWWHRMFLDDKVKVPCASMRSMRPQSETYQSREVAQ